MRFMFTALLWLLMTVGLAVALPAAWTQQNLIDIDGYAAFAEQAAADPALQQAMAAELTTQAVALGYTGRESVLAAVASQYTSSPNFPAQFAAGNRLAHRWLFTDRVAPETDSQGRWLIDISPMLRDSSFEEQLRQFDITVPETLPVPLTQNAPAELRPGQLQAVARWGPGMSVGITVLTAVLALLTLAASRSRGKGLAALGVSGLLVGAAGWAALEVGRRRAEEMLGGVGRNVQQIADSLIRHAIDSMHQWLNITLAVGGGLVAVGVLVPVLGGVTQRTVRKPS